MLRAAARFSMKPPSVMSSVPTATAYVPGTDIGRDQRCHSADRDISIESAPTGVGRRRCWIDFATSLRADCGGRFSPCAMDFDHRDPAQKSAEVTRMVGRAGTQRILDEVAKCDIVCANCHRLRTYRRRSMAPLRE